MQLTLPILYEYCPAESVEAPGAGIWRSREQRTLKRKPPNCAALIPQPIIGHYDRLRVRGKKGVAVVRNQVCTGCHMHVPIGQITMLMRGEDIQLCESCGRYLYLPDPAETESLARAEAAKPAAKARPSPGNAGLWRTPSEPAPGRAFEGTSRSLNSSAGRSCACGL